MMRPRMHTCPHAMPSMPASGVTPSGVTPRPAHAPLHPPPQREYLCFFLHRLLDFRVPEVRAGNRGLGLSARKGG
jgi:hypothetical protein